jgi:hypothetical protein
MAQDTDIAVLCRSLGFASGSFPNARTSRRTRGYLVTFDGRRVRCVALGATERTTLPCPAPELRWFMYQPNANALMSPSASDGDSVRAAVVWLIAIALWLGISWRLFRTKSE